jgi:hypothetical protein
MFKVQLRTLAPRRCAAAVQEGPEFFVGSGTSGMKLSQSRRELRVTFALIQPAFSATRLAISKETRAPRRASSQLPAVVRLSEMTLLYGDLAARGIVNTTRPGTCKQSGVATPNHGLTSMWKEMALWIPAQAKSRHVKTGMPA